ncbi:MAG: type II CAAX endopeptidase family protein [Bryobacteraceae bacterium]
MTARAESSEPLILAQPEAPFWGFGEIFIGLAVFLAALLVVGGVADQYLHSAARRGYWAVAEEFSGYVILFAALKIIFFLKQRPMFRSLGWVPHSFGTLPLIGLGFVLVLASVALQLLLRTPEKETPFDLLLNGDWLSRIVISVFGITLGPIIEELLFRGFLQPVLVNAAGVFPGIMIASCLFGAAHLSQNAGIWQSAVLIGGAGFVFGVVRHVSGSTRASSIVHMAYNFVPFCITLMQGAASEHK